MSATPALVEASPTQGISSQALSPLPARALALPCTLVLEVQTLSFSVGDLMALCPGTIVRTAAQQNEDLPLMANGQLVGLVEFDVVGGTLSRSHSGDRVNNQNLPDQAFFETLQACEHHRVSNLPEFDTKFNSTCARLIRGAQRAFVALLGTVQRTQSRRIRVRENVSLGEKRFIALVEVDGEQLLIGGGHASVSLLKHLNPQTSEARSIEHAPEVSG